MEQKDIERSFLEDTRDILIGYDGCHTEEQLKGLIDETRERLTKLLNGEVTKIDLGISFNLDSPFEVLEGGKGKQSEENTIKSSMIQQIDSKAKKPKE